jgi:hypothetical protein
MDRLFSGRRAWLLAAISIAGCSGPRVDFSQIPRPARSPEMDAYNVFVGSWDWTAQVTNAEGANKDWKGTAKWDWALDKRTLEGEMAARSANAEFTARGVWSWHPKKKDYIWWMFNDWGYPQQGEADYDESERCWRMNYKSVGLDGTKSHGRYIVRVVDNDTLDWRMQEWADPLHMVQKMEMNGTYKRKK